jgi:DNA (cytosine-5)-methyltransferase 1
MNRRASHKELLQLQGFPKDFVIDVSDTNFRKQIGNAMSVNVLEALFSKLLLSV